MGAMHSEQARAFRQAYLETIYHAKHGDLEVAFTLHAAPTGERVFAGRTFALITAANPYSKELSDAENAERNARMQTAFKARGFAFDSSCGTNAGLTWREDGFVVFDVPVQAMLEFGREFEQNAIVYGEEDRVALGWCFDGALEWFWPRVRSTE